MCRCRESIPRTGSGRPHPSAAGLVRSTAGSVYRIIAAWDVNTLYSMTVERRTSDVAVPRAPVEHRENYLTGFKLLDCPLGGVVWG